MQKAEAAKNEKNRAAVATLNSEVRRSKAALRAELPKLQKLAAKKVHVIPSSLISKKYKCTWWTR